MTRRRFPAPWQIVEIPGGWKVEDANGVSVAYVYGEEGPRGVSDDRMTKNEARRVAAGIARLPELLGRRGYGATEA
jgi:hypothetical protein